MDKQYTTHLCTFMGREANLEILIPYIEGALLNNAIDNYWFIDMTRKPSDHELIKRESARLNEKFPGRVHLYNSEHRAKIINDPEQIAAQTWAVFYKFLKTFGDNDIIAKCDDDTYFIDISTLQAAFEYRWKNKKPYLMHANAINNGVCAYHQSQAGIWKHKDAKTYPPKGLSGPVFSNAEMACEMHKQFAGDLTKNINNIEKYKLNKNILFTNRVSINFIFMLGKDRHELSKITAQDEYDTSCKYAQRENRPNVLIGDFIMAHHTYGSQEETMEKIGTDKWYRKLRDVLNPAETVIEHQEICSDSNPTSTISKSGRVLMRAWVNKDTYILKDTDPVDGRTYVTKICEPNNRGDVMMNYLTTGSEFADACLFEIQPDKPHAIWLLNTNQIIKAPVNPLKDDKQTAMVGTIGGWTKERRTEFMKLLVKKLPKGLCTIQCAEKGFEKMYVVPTRMHSKYGNNCKDRIFFNLVETKWELVPMQGMENQLVAASIKRPKNFLQYANDETYATCDQLPTLGSTDYTWTIQDYIWEFVPTNKDDTYHIKLIADDKPDMYLHYNKGKDQVMTGAKQEWKFIDKKPKYLQHVQTGMYLDVQDGVVTMSKKMSELAICPQK